MCMFICENKDMTTSRLNIYWNLLSNKLLKALYHVYFLYKFANIDMYFVGLCVNWVGGVMRRLHMYS